MNKGEVKKRFSTGSINATVWKNNSAQDQEPYHMVSFERSYKDKNGNWKTTKNLRVKDLPRAALVLEEAFRFLSIAEKQEV